MDKNAPVKFEPPQCDRQCSSNISSPEDLRRKCLLMNKAQSGIQPQQLWQKHLSWCRRDETPETILALLCADGWFQEKLAMHVSRTVRIAPGIGVCPDDIRQEALLILLSALRRRSCLGFDPEKGSYAGFLHTILGRACCKALRQFKHSNHWPIDDEAVHPLYDPVDSWLELMGLREEIAALGQPYRRIMESLSAGKTVDETAECLGKCRRTIYRWIDEAIRLMRGRV